MTREWHVWEPIINLENCRKAVLREACTPRCGRNGFAADLREHDTQLEGQISSLFSTADIYNKNDHKDEEWTHATFDEVPICASITLLTKIQNDIRACEGQVLKYLFDRTDAADLRVNKFSAYVIPEPSDFVKLCWPLWTPPKRRISM